MSNFDWEAFFNQYAIDYSTSGSNVSRGNAVIHCPFCGSADEGKHMSVSTEGRGWRCFRHPDHAGKNPSRLIQALIGCTHDQARQLIGDSVYIPDDLVGRISKALAGPQHKRAPNALTMPSEFRTIKMNSVLARPYVRFLIDKRGFTEQQVATLTKRYGVRYAESGPYRGRIIFPVIENGELVGWTGRAIFKKATLRYKTLSDDHELAANEGYTNALEPLSNYLLFHDYIVNSDADTIYICEGPFDALKVSVLGRKHGAVATCFFTASPSHAQVGRLSDIMYSFRRRVLLLDRGTMGTALRTISKFSGQHVIVGELPGNLKDPGDFSKETFLWTHKRAMRT